MTAVDNSALQPSPAAPAETQPAIRVLLADDSELMRRGIKTVLAAESDPAFVVISETTTVQATIAECSRLHPDIVLLDICMGGRPAVETCTQVLQRTAGTRVVILTGESNDALVYEAVKSGAKGYLKKDIPPKRFVQALRDVATGRSILDPDATTRVLRLLRGGGAHAGNALSLLSAQECRVLALVADGLTNRQVGKQLGLSENTVKNYLVNAFDKLNVKRRAQAAAIYVQQSAGRRRTASG